MDTRSICLAVLSRGAASGYEIKKTCEEGVFHHIQDIGFGSIYPALGKLLDEGLVTVTDTPQEGRPSKKVYQLTATGRMALLDAFSEAPVRGKIRSDFLVRLLFADFLAARTLEGMIEDRMRFLREKIVHMESCEFGADGTAGKIFVHGFGLAIYRAMEAYLREHSHKVIGASLLSERGAAE